jgi:outer membrane protein OmpA-like peptidoglycan-associated protein
LQRSRIALNTAQYRKAESAIATSGEQRNRVLLRAREQEAENAKSQARAAELARAEAELRAEQLAMANPPQTAKPADLGSELARLKGQIRDLKAEQTERGWVLTLRSDVLFDSGSATLKPGARRAVDNLARFMERYPEREIAIEGFTDSVGAPEANRRLSESRAAAVKKALAARGVEPSRIDARGYGPAFPVASNETPTGRQLNRRVEIVINPS